MTIKYESEILFDLMKRDGDDAPSDVLPYESELKEKYLNQVVGAYPKLQDYRPEWLNYNLYQHIPSDFPVESVANVTSASFENVVPYAYKSVILKGQTMVNICNATNRSQTLTPSSRIFHCNLKQTLKANQTYTCFATISDSTSSNKISIQYTHIDGTYSDSTLMKASTNGRAIIKFNKTQDITEVVIYILKSDKGQAIVSDVMIIEGDYTNVDLDIPYFEGMKSVQMPVLTTTGKNLFNLNKVIELEGLVVKNDSLHIGNRMFPDEVIYTFENAPTESILTFDISSTDVVNSGGALASIWYEDGTYSWITISNRRYVNKKRVVGVKIHNWCEGTHIISNIQLEEGISETPYEPFKSNILTVNEEVTLRGIGDVKDELDCFTGQVTERIGEIVLDGTQYMDSDGYGVYIQVNDVKRFLDYTDKIACDKLPVIPTYQGLENVENGISGYTNSSSYLGQNWLYVKINNSVNTDEVKEWLTQNPITVQYQRVTESIKTVDLSCVNEQGDNETFRPIEGTMHVNTSSQALPPLLDMTVPVEATTQNLMSFANIEVEE